MTLTKQDFSQLDQLLDKKLNQHLEKQDKSIEKRFELLPGIIREEIKVAIDEAIEEKQIVTKADIAHLPTKEEFYKSQSELMAEIKKVREEQPI